MLLYGLISSKANVTKEYCYLIPYDSNLYVKRNRCDFMWTVWDAVEVKLRNDFKKNSL